MLNWCIKRVGISAGLSVYLIGETAFALVKSAEGHDEISVTGTVATAYDSNINSAPQGKSDIITSTTLALDYLRNAGMIGVKGDLAYTHSDFAANAAENFTNPTLSLELTKKSGRTTGAATLSAARRSKPDATINQRTDSWNYDAGLNWKYPAIDRYTLAGSFNYGMIDYMGANNALTNLTTKSASTDFLYKYNSQRELLAGYRVRESETYDNNQSIDQAVTTGVSGKILAKLKGIVRAGYQIRQEGTMGQSFGSTTASAAATWAINKRFTLTGTVEKDFSTTPTGTSIDSLSFNLDAQYVMTYQWALFSGLGTGNSNFLNGVELDRRDNFSSCYTGASYTLNKHLRVALNYSYLQNGSNRSTSCFERNTLTLNLSSRW